MLERVDPHRLADICRRYGVARLEVFGSTVRGTASQDSDVDLLYTLLPGARLGWEIDDLVAELTALSGRPVDLVSRSALHDRIRVAVESEARPVYAAV